MHYLRNLRIGMKLAISAAVGVVLVTGMMINQARVAAITAKLDSEVKASDALLKGMLGAEVALRRVIIMQRDIRAAIGADTVDKALERVDAFARDGHQALDRALAAAQRTEDRDDLTQGRKLFDDYVGVIRETATMQKGALNLLAQQSQQGVVWQKKYAEFMKLPAFADEPKRAELIRTIEHADGAFKQARLIFWAYLQVRTPDQPGRLQQFLNQTGELMKKAQELATESSIKKGLEELSTFPPAYREVIGKALTAYDAQGKVMAERADPLRLKIDDLFAKRKAVIEKRSTEAAAESAAQDARSWYITLVSGILVVMVMIGSAVFSAMNIGRPIRRIGEVLLRLADGDKAVDVPYAQRGDEVGDAARAARTFKDNLIRLEQMEAERAEVERRATAERQAEMRRMADEFQAAVGGIVDTVSSASSQLESAATTLTGNATTTQELSNVVSSASEEASANVQSVAAATEELTGSVSEISRQVQESSRIAADAVSQAERTDSRIAALSQAASRIGDVVKLITAIAEQTNLLALNATIEAARAGEAGKGFAVVASEVKTLASQTAKATDEIGAQISAMQGATQESVAAIKEIGATIGRMSEISSTIAAAVEEQGASTQEIARNVHNAAQGTAQVAANIGDVKRGAGETGAASSQVLTAARSLSSESHHLKAEVEKFLATVRAA
jgi:methyl-accepting chemotaxis protein